jgi:hypothetical protein
MPTLQTHISQFYTALLNFATTNLPRSRPQEVGNLLSPKNVSNATPHKLRQRTFKDDVIIIFFSPTQTALVATSLGSFC